jgi:hypothetical protein
MTIPGVTSPISDNSAPFELKGLSRSAADEEVAFFRDSGATVDVVSEGADLFTVRIISADGAIQRVIVMLPGAPKAAVEALRAAIPRVNADKLYAEEAEKAFGFVPQWEASPRHQQGGAGRVDGAARGADVPHRLHEEFATEVAWHSAAVIAWRDTRFGRALARERGAVGCPPRQKSPGIQRFTRDW